MITHRKLTSMFSSLIVTFSLTFSAFQPASVSAQGEDGIKRQVNAESGKVSFIGPEKGQVLSASTALGTFIRPQDPAMALAKRFGPEFGLKNPDQELSELKASRPEDGRVTVHYQQNYQGIPVLGGELIVNTNQNGDLYSMNGEVSPDLSLQTQPGIASEQARDTTLQAVAKWYQKTPADFIASKPELWIFDESLLQPSSRPAELVWRMEVTAVDNSLPVRELVLVNAQNGRISLHFNQTDTAWDLDDGDNPPLPIQDIPTPTPMPSDINTPDVTETKIPDETGTSPSENPHIYNSQNEVSPATGTGYYVNINIGNNSNSCTTVAAPCKNIQEAINKASSGDTIYATTGTYFLSTNGSANVVIINKNITLSGGWDASFNSQTGASTIDGENTNNGILSISGTVRVENFIIQNSRSSNSGAIYIVNGNFTLRNSTLHSNTATSNGGGIFIDSGALTISNSTISGNTANASGGGIYAANNNAISVTIKDSTIAYNSAATGGGITRTNGVHLITNTIIANNSASVASPDCNGTILSANYNIIENNTGCTITYGLNNLNVDPQIDSNLTETALVHKLLAGSPAINGGDPNGVYCPAKDQLGHSRPQGSICDMGAVEFGMKAIVATDGLNQTAYISTAFAQPLVVYVQDENFAPASGVQVTFSAPSSGASGIFSSTGTRTTTVATDANGMATTSTFTANATGGTYNVVASAAGYNSSQFQLKNRDNFWYVAIFGNNSNDCSTPTTPCKAIAGVLSKTDFIPGNVIKMSTGTYNDVFLNNISKDVSISGGWSNDFTAQNGATIISDQITIASNTTVEIADINIQGIASSGIENSGNLTLERVAIYYIDSSDSGAAIYQISGQLDLNNVTISNNISTSGSDFGNILSGGGIYVNSGTVVINNSTITQNVVIDYETSELSRGGGIANPNNSPVTITNSIIAGNVSTVGPDCYGSIISGGHNLFGTSSGCSISPQSTDLFATQGNNINVMLGNLQSNGGLTITHALLPGSSAIDAGDPLTCASVDQRGVSRPQAAVCDIGAYEGSVTQALTGLIYTYSLGNANVLNLPGDLKCRYSASSCAYYQSINPDVVNAHTYTFGIYNFYFDKHGRYSIDNHNAPIISSVDYLSGYNNAFWNGFQMIYGDGYPGADDVVGHELTHGVTQYESNLFYYYQSGAINESFSDVWGELYDQENGLATDNSGVKWLMGEDLPSGVIRSMSNPPAYGDPDKMTSANYYKDAGDNGGVHYNSGINNKAVYLMVDGGTFNGKTVTAIGADKTLAIYYEAQTNLLSSGADYSDLYYALQQACTDLIGQKGITSGNCVEVKDAIDAVEMNLQPSPNFNTDAPLCTVAGTAPINVFSDDLESGASNWTINNGAYTRWQYDSPYGTYAHSGTHFLYADDYPAVITDATATLAPVMIPANAYLHFAHAYDFEAYLPVTTYYDGGMIEYSANDGATWVDAGSLIDYNGYIGVLDANYGNPLANRSAFAGTSHGYISTRLNLAPLAGESVSFRWRMGLDNSGFGGGWSLDDVRIYNCAGRVISGNVGTADVTLSYIDGIAKTTTSLADGSYSFQVSNNWSGTVNPTHACYTFNPVNRTYSNITADQTAQNYISTIIPASGCANINVAIGGVSQGTYGLPAQQSQRVNYFGVNTGPVKVVSTNGVPIIAAIRESWWDGSTWSNFYQLMGLPASQVSDTYLFPAYNNVSLDEQLRFGNVGVASTTVTVTIAGVVRGTYVLAPNESTRVNYAGLNSGPVVVKSSGGVPIIAAIRDSWWDGATWSSFSQLMGLPAGQVSDTYLFPAYNNVSLDEQLRFGNVGVASTTVTVTIAGVVRGTYVLAPNESARVNYAGLNSGPVVVKSSGGVPIIAAIRDSWWDGATWSDFNQLMGLPAGQVSDTYLFPAYNNVSLDEQLRFGNVGVASTTVTVTIAGVVRGTYVLAPNESARVNYAGLNSGPVVVKSSGGVPIIAAIRDSWWDGATWSSFAQTMGLPAGQVSDTYLFPAYNNVSLDEQLRFGVP